MKATLLTTPRATANKWLHDNFAPHIAKDIIKMANTMLWEGHDSINLEDRNHAQQEIRESRKKDPDRLIIDHTSSVHVSERMTNSDLQNAVFTYIFIHDMARIEREKRNEGKEPRRRP
jgi:hypothetical protein